MNYVSWRFVFVTSRRIFITILYIFLTREFGSNELRTDRSLTHFQLTNDMIASQLHFLPHSDKSPQLSPAVSHSDNYVDVKSDPQFSPCLNIAAGITLYFLANVALVIQQIKKGSNIAL